MTKRMREYVVHWLLLHGTDWVKHNEVDDVFYANYHLPTDSRTQANESVLSVMMKGGYIAQRANQHNINIAFKLADKAMVKMMHETNKVHEGELSYDK